MFFIYLLFFAHTEIRRNTKTDPALSQIFEGHQQDSLNRKFVLPSALLLFRYVGFWKNVRFS